MKSSITHPLPDAERWSLLSWCVLVLFVGIPGNLTIFLACRKYHAFRLDKISVCLIEQIAVCDLGVLVLAVVPSCIALITGYWPLGSTACGLFFYPSRVCIRTSVLLVCALHVCKLYTIIFPLQARFFKQRAARFITALVWTVPILIVTVRAYFQGRIIGFNIHRYICAFETVNPHWKIVAFLMVTISIAAMIIVICTTVWLLCLVRKTNGNLKRQGLFTALYVGIVYVVSFLPLSIAAVLVFVIHADSHPAVLEAKQRFMLFAQFVIYINAMSNVLVYYVSVKSFQIFLKRVFILLKRRLQRQVGTHSIELNFMRRN